MGFFDDDDDDNMFKHSHYEHDIYYADHTMDITIGLVGTVVAVALLSVCIWRCCCRRNTGRVLAPPPLIPPVPPGHNNVQIVQQYAPMHSAPPQVTPNTTIIHTASPAPYPQQPAPYPQQTYPAPAPYPQQTYPPAAYPQGVYPQTAPYPTAMPQPGQYPAVPNAPEVHAFYGIAPPGWNTQALPPSYEQVMGPADSSQHAKQPPYNPYLSH